MLKKMLVVLGSIVLLFSSFGRVEAKGKRIRTFVVSPITGVKILPDTPMMSIPGFISSEIKMVATPGEYEPASFVIHALFDISSLKIKATDLKGKEGMIPLENIDIKIVKCWYQGETAWSCITHVKDKRVLVPELLLNDDSLVKVDYKEEKNHLKLSFPEEEKYVWISNSKEEKDIWGETQHGTGILSVDKFPVKDSSKLLPVNISAKTNKQIWVTVRVPDNAEEGVYEGNINLSAGKKTLAVLALKVRVLPFKLASPKTHYDIKEDFCSSICYRGKLNPDCPEGSISSEYKSEKQLKAEMENMFAHGVTNPTYYGGGEKYFKIRNEAGMENQTLYTMVSNVGSAAIACMKNPQAKEEILKTLQKNLKKTMESYRSKGIEEVYFYGLDEARGEKLKAMRDVTRVTHEAGARMFSYGYMGSNFPVIGDLQDLLICAGWPTTTEAAKWHSVGHKIWCYGNPQAGPENPEIFRRNYGFLLWKANYDGAAIYAYQHSFDNIWNDFGRFWRDHCFTYPTVDGVIDTIAWEGYREGIDDIRYATTLRLEIEKAKKSGRGKARRIAAEAEKYLEEMDVEGGNMDTMRMEIINYILKIREEK